MPNVYCTDEEVADREPGYDPSDATEKASMDRIRALVSRQIDRWLGRTPSGTEWFPEAGEEPSARTFYGNGTAYLALDAFLESSVDVADVSLPSGYTAPSFVYRDGYLVTTDAAGGLYGDRRGGAVWPAGVAVTVTRTWGYPAAAGGTSGVPGDIVEAAVLMCVARWRERVADRELGGTVGTSFEEPPRARAILEERRRMRALVGAA